jgi:energy-coupling factor transporter ATP-binding protein EcfA2
MVKEELIQRSPVRIFMNSINGGLKPGELGLIASPSGIGKTSVLVQIALDKLLQDKKVIHISFTRQTNYVLAWYEDIFDEFIKKKNLENEQEVKNNIVKNRVLIKFSQGGVTSDQILRSLMALIKSGFFNAEVIIIDGFDFSAAEEGHVAAIKSFASEMGVSCWYSCNVTGEQQSSDRSSDQIYDQRYIPLVLEGNADLFDVIIVLEPKSDHIELTVSRDRDVYNPEHLALKLDPKTLLILEN